MNATVSANPPSIGRAEGRVLLPARDEKPHGPRIVFRVTHEICDALLAQCRDLAALTGRKFMPCGLGKDGIEVIAESAIEEIDARDLVRLTIDHQSHGLIDLGKLHATKHTPKRPKRPIRLLPWPEVPAQISRCDENVSNDDNRIEFDEEEPVHLLVTISGKAMA